MSEEIVILREEIAKRDYIISQLQNMLTYSQFERERLIKRGEEELEHILEVII